MSAPSTPSETEAPTSPELSSLTTSQKSEDDNIDDNIDEDVTETSATSLNVSHLSEADRNSLYASLMPPTIQQPADIQKVYRVVIVVC